MRKFLHSFAAFALCLINPHNKQRHVVTKPSDVLDGSAPKALSDFIPPMRVYVRIFVVVLTGSSHVACCICAALSSSHSRTFSLILSQQATINDSGLGLTQWWEGSQAVDEDSSASASSPSDLFPNADAAAAAAAGDDSISEQLHSSVRSSMQRQRHAESASDAALEDEGNGGDDGSGGGGGPAPEDEEAWEQPPEEDELIVDHGGRGGGDEEDLGDVDY
jgi:hypothetical protein